MSLSVNNNNYMNNQNSFLLSKPSQTNYLEDGTSQIITETQIKHNNNGRDKTLQEIWSMHNFADEKVKVEKLQHNFTMKMSWANCFSNNNNNTTNSNNNNVVELEREEDKFEAVNSSSVNIKESSSNNVNSSNESSMQEMNDLNSPTSPPPVTSPSHHARRPMNAFLIFCKKHRPIVREIYPKLENRGVTKILGEWWEYLDDEDKQPYRDLAKEYKDAFFCANPNFRWYKLPAPPLRTCPSRPNSLQFSSNVYMNNQFKDTITNLPTQKISATVPQSSPSNNNNNITNNYNNFSEFTPGKLADESQLGGLTSLMTNNFVPKPKITNCCDTASHINNNNNTNSDFTNKDEAPDKRNCKDESPVNLITSPNLPPKPIKKRKLENFEMENTEVAESKVRKVLDLNEDYSKDLKEEPAEESNTNMEKVQDVKERKSNRQCKGKRYEKFMFEGKLLGNKKDAKLTQQKVSHHNLGTDLDNNKSDTPKLDLSNTIKRLIERTKPQFQHCGDLHENEIKNKRLQETAVSEKDTGVDADSATNSHNQRNEFNLDLKISNLPSLSYELFSQRKRECKKRKFRSKTDVESNNKLHKIDKSSNKQLVGSKKRKNKESITHLSNENSNNDSVVSTTHNPNNDLLGLATLAEIAAQTEKISE